MAKIELTVTDTYVVEISDEDTQEYYSEGYDRTYGNDLGGVAQWVLETRGDYSMPDDHEVDWNLLNETYRLLFESKSHRIDIYVTVSSYDYARITSNSVFDRDYGRHCESLEQTREAVAAWIAFNEMLSNKVQDQLIQEGYTTEVIKED